MPWSTFVFLLIAISTGSKANAYPEFIGYGYASCLTCHYNGNGGGPLTDYGRALWSSEIASRAFYSNSMTDEEIAAQSGFMGRVELPSWIRPHADYRGLLLRLNPGGAPSPDSRYYQMQTEIGVTLQNPSGKWVGVLTLGRVIPSSEFELGHQGLNHMTGSEYYARVELAKTWWLYAGLIEKVYGIRNIDHTSYQRAYQSFNVQTDTADGDSNSLGLILQKVSKTWELSANAFFGNPEDSAAYKQSGGSAMGEFEVAENTRIGASLFSAHSPTKDKKMAGVHLREQLSHGGALMLESGLIKDTLAISSTSVGTYQFAEALVPLARGYNIITDVERYNVDFRPSSTDQWRWAFGFLLFPAPRFEIRAEAVNSRNISSQPNADTWAIEGQIHVSL